MRDNMYLGIPGLAEQLRQDSWQAQVTAIHGEAIPTPMQHLKKKKLHVFKGRTRCVSQGDRLSESQDAPGRNRRIHSDRKEGQMASGNAAKRKRALTRSKEAAAKSSGFMIFITSNEALLMPWERARALA